ncbi:helix-turn-helix transcriptional regulator [Flavobacterium sp. UBA6135]|uniref:helix-turn-helix transcriptional regulator n=1 Tax=Flavobacterium sp. UBA6135 TaxID=1946553 RepID=UPI0025C40922|nr:helix-turn-helix transcriptional regulator [Flavobacterium sp. UBA6135]
MEKFKLIEVRKKKGISQQQIAEKLCIDVSNYNRREKGLAKIHSSEWVKLASILDVPIEDIFEVEETTFIICKDQSVGINQGTNNVYTIPEFILESQRKYIQKLEEENLSLKERLKE